MLTLVRTKAAFWTGAGAIALLGAATTLAATGGDSQDEAPPEDTSAVVLALEPMLAEEANEEEGNGDEGEEATVRGVPEDSPACENVGCGEVENAGGVTLHLPQPAVDGITRAAENREAARNRDGGEEEDEGGDGVEEAAEEDEESSEDSVRGVPEDSPACENVGCGEVENAGGVTLHLPQPAVDGINRAAENRAAAQEKAGGAGKPEGKGKP